MRTNLFRIRQAQQGTPEIFAAKTLGFFFCCQAAFPGTDDIWGRGLPKLDKFGPRNRWRQLRMTLSIATCAQLTPIQSGRIAVILPCHNEATAIANVVKEFQAALPSATIYVIDNASTDTTSLVASEAGAAVIAEPLRGKGNAVRRAFAAIDADIYVMADGDGTYDAGPAVALIAALRNEHLDMVVGKRRHIDESAYRRGHQLGNRLFCSLLRVLFGSSLTDIFSGYRVFSRRFVKSFPALSTGFEIETEMSVHATSLRLSVKEIPCHYRPRMTGTGSKLRTYRDGIRILVSMTRLFRHHRPFIFFGMLAALCIVIALILFVPVLIAFLKTGLVMRMPTVILCTGLVLTAGLLMTTGLILDTTTKTQLEIRRLLYLNSNSESSPK
jgi:glycosyltransferase involved in cell wall biosynthesis